MIDPWLQDVRYAARLLRRNPVFALTAALSLAIGIGANTTIFTVANALLFKPPAGVVDADRLVDVGRSQDGQGFDNNSYPNYLDLRARSPVFTDVYAYRLGPEAMSLGGRDGAERIYGEMVTTNYFSILGTRAHAGRLFLPSDGDRPGETPLTVLSHRFWMRRFNGDAAVVGTTLQLNGRPFTVIGVAPEGFHGTTILTGDVWVPVNMVAEIAPRHESSLLASRESVWLVMGARLKPGVSLRQAQAETDAIGRALEREFPEQNRGRGLRMVASSPIPGNGAPVAAFMALLMAIAGAVLAIACANVAGVLLARATARRREIAVRLAIGAGRARLVRQLLVESALLFVVGAAAGLALARVATTIVTSAVPTLPVPVDVELALDARAIAFTIALSLAASVLAGIVPALHASRSEVIGGLKADAQGTPERQRLRNAFVVAQVAFSLVLIVAAGLFGRALQHAADVDPGFDTRGIEIASLDLSLAGYTADTGRPFARALVERVRALPGVQSAALGAVVPLSGSGLGLGGLRRPAADASTTPSLRADWNVVTPGYFAMMKMRLVAGRDFSEADRDNAAPVIIVNETAARRFWSTPRATDVIGRTILQQVAPPGTPNATRAMTVIAVSADTKYRSLGEDPRGVRLRAVRSAVHPAHVDPGAIDRRPAPRRRAQGARRVDESESADCRRAHAGGIRVARPDSAARRRLDRREPRVRRTAARRHRHLRRHGVHGNEPHARVRDPHGARRAARRRDADGASAGHDADDRRLGDRPRARRRRESAARVAALRHYDRRSADVRRLGDAVLGDRAGGVLRPGAPRDAHRRDAGAEVRVGSDLDFLAVGIGGTA